MMNGTRRLAQGFLAAGVLALTWTSPAFAKDHPAEQTVYPTGMWPADVINVQAAVAAGGKVLLKAVDRSGTPRAFNFGTPESLPQRRVLLDVGVDVSGERDHGARTTIQGGFIPFLGRAPVPRRIHGILFAGSMWLAIEIDASAGLLEISGNRISGVVPGLTRFQFTSTEGIGVGGSLPGAVSGVVRILDNWIDDMSGDFRTPIQLDEIAADVEIARNTISLGQSPDGGSVDSGAIYAVRCNAGVRITENAIAVGPGLVYTGILGYGNRNATYRISGNVVTSESPFADGIAFIGGGGNDGVVDGVIEDNVVSMHASSYGGISLYGLVTGATVRDNVVEGDGAFGLFVGRGYLPTDLAVGNRLLDNNLRHFTAAVADVFLDANTQDTTVEGSCGSTIDLGKNNHLSCD